MNSPIRPLLPLCLAVAGLLLRATAASSGTGPALITAIRAGDHAEAKALLTTPGQLSSRDAAGNTPLHVAALRGNVAAVELLLKAGAKVNVTNQAGATPLLYGAHSENIVRQLLARGADPNIVSTNGQTPLLAAVMCGESYPAVRLLIEHGAEVNARRFHDRYGRALPQAIFARDRRTIDLLIRRGATTYGTNDFSPLASAAFAGDLNTARRLLDLGVDMNFNAGFAGHALNWAFYARQPELAALLIERGADLRFPSPAGHRTPPMVWSAYNETGDATLARALVARGVDVHAANESGETALDWALRRGNETALVKFLREAGVTNGAPKRNEKRTPQRAVPTELEARSARTRESVQTAITALERTSDAFLANSFVRHENCTSCHQQTLPAVAFGWARERGFRVDETHLERLLSAQASFWNPRAEKARQLDEPTPDAPNSLGWGLQGLHALGYQADDFTGAMLHYLVSIQGKDGSWPSYDWRPPMEDGVLMGTALAAHAVQLYPLAGRERESKEALQRARQWLARAKPRTHNERVFQLLGLSWCGRSPEKLASHVKTLLAEQRADGGWAQLPGLDCDAWATGQALVALHQAGRVPTSHTAYQRGVEFLLRTQFYDGSWWVRSRTWPFQPHFDSQFPHGKDQWISAAGTAWATMALLLTIEPTASKDAFPTAQQLITTAARKRTTPVTPSSAPQSLGQRDAGALGDPVFTRDILPIFQKSCADCHGGEKPKGDLSVETVAALVKGGQSGEAAIVLGQPDRSPLLRLVTDQVEDLEMPPLAKRAKYPALTPAEVQRLRAWVADGKR